MWYSKNYWVGLLGMLQSKKKYRREAFLKFYEKNKLDILQFGVAFVSNSNPAILFLQREEKLINRGNIRSNSSCF